ncbi:hypothetical protein GCM10010521_71680 [Streptomyces rameus]|uniref:Tr-type G domain-containing protein n=1 Tax=Streptomyces rameus TaxID=68261 RepID=A0ABN3V7Y3_9ACTN
MEPPLIRAVELKGAPANTWRRHPAWADTRTPTWTPSRRDPCTAQVFGGARPPVKVGTIGGLDHGKTTLAQAVAPSRDGPRSLAG